jgi:ATP-dependent DNA helicase RecQ
MFKQLPKLQALLRSYFGFENFRGQQEDIINSILNRTDTFVIMPTGGGKSLCYQLPALASEGTAIVISPLIALMKNQVDLIRSYSSEENIAHFLNSSLTKAQIRKVKDDITVGKTKILYVAPESLVKEENLDFLRSIKVSFVAVDEAHCISEWGHDFRPEYRKIRKMIDAIEGGIPVMALTATATPKVQSDIIKTLNMRQPRIFKDSFLRHNLYYEIRPKVSKDAAEKDIIRFIKKEKGKSGIIYCLSRKSTEDLANRLVTNGIRAVAYHAGLDAKTRTETQDKFLMEEYDVIVATIAFGMGIDKPDVRYVIHYDVPKSLENYYQETGRAGRDGLEGQCITYYSPKDIDKMEKLLRDKPVAEREIGLQHLAEMEAYAVSGECRKRLVLHYFGEEMGKDLCGNMCDNCRNPKPKVEAMQELKWLLETIVKTNEQLTLANIINILTGKPTKDILAYGYDKLSHFGKGKDRDNVFWESLGRKAILDNLIYKEIEQYGILKITSKGKDFIKNPHSFPVIMNQVFVAGDDDDEANGSGNVQALDNTLFEMLKSLRLKEAKRLNLMPWVIFMDTSLQEMATLYPINMEELSKINGVSTGKANKYGRPFLQLIAKYVEENDITRPSDFSEIKGIANKLNNKIKIIELIDKRIPLKDIARNRGISLNDLITELENIVMSGTKVNIKYDLDENIDSEIQEMIFDYFSEADSESVEKAYKELKDEDIEMDEIRLVRIRYLSEVAN